MKLQLLILLCLSAPLYVACDLSSDGLTLLSLLSHWTSVPPSLKSSWKSSDSTPCSWRGIQCDRYSNVISLNLTASRIFGQLGPDIGQLTHLQNLVLGTNGFSGKIPPELGNCSLLEHIDLSYNYFNGKIPYTLKDLQSLRYLSLSSNLLTGEIPKSLFRILKLEQLDLHNNSLYGPIPSNIGNTTRLLKLHLSTNQLSGTIPSSIGNCSQLEAIFVNDNILTGILPESLNNLKNLIYLDVKNNSLGGTFPFGSGTCAKLFILDLSFNVFSGGIPSGFGNCSSLAEFVAVKSNLVGGIPSSLGLLPKLSILRLPENHLSGNIPPEIGNCKSLKKLHLYANQLGGTIPSELGGLSKLEDLELSFNHLTGEIPLTIWKIQSLKHILLHNNSLYGKLPSEMTELKHMKNISLFDNQFSGPIPQSLGINSSLVKLDLMNNKFTGSIPPNLCFGRQLRLLNLGLNQLQGSAPHDVGRCVTLTRLVVNENNLSRSLPEFYGNQNLKYMDLSKNNISGAIPSSLGNCTSLTGLILSTNNIAGHIPSEVGKLVNLTELNLPHNNLEGPLPHQLSYCTKMEIFDVGFNFLNGSFPSSMKTWTMLTKLILRENHFSGVIPSFLSEYGQLLDLQLGGNAFSGKIPTSIGSLRNLLYGLNLSANNLIGEIPLEIGKLKKLQSLDMSLNNLTGNIYVLNELSSLIEVNISYNSFVGPIPEWKTQHLNLSPSSFLGNPSLCVHCSTSNGLSCNKTGVLKPCDSESIDHKVNKLVILDAILGFLVLAVYLWGVLLIYNYHFGQRYEKEAPADFKKKNYIHHYGLRYMEDVIPAYGERESLPLNYEGHFRIMDLMNATGNLNDRYIIGRGGSGIVYKAELDLGVFAIKKVEFAPNRHSKLSMIREIKMSRYIRHRNVARCLGSWIGEEYGLTITKYMENGSLHDVLHEINPQRSLAWNVRYEIAIGIAKGLAYLHHDCDPPILHRDIKPKNILLDSDMQPCITDFGISIALNQSSTSVQLILGTIGFMAPEVAYAIAPTCELDVYSYGVVLLELITRRQVLESSFVEEDTTLVRWFKSVWRRTREIEDIVDSSLARELSDLNVMVQAIKVLLVALLCTEKDSRKRLKMRDIVEFLETPTNPGVFIQHDRASFHLGSSLVTAAATLFLQILEEEVEIPANESSVSVIREFKAVANPNNLDISSRTQVVHNSQLIQIPTDNGSFSVLPDVIRATANPTLLEVNANYEEQDDSYLNDEGDFRIIDLIRATENLHHQHIIGQGGHGIVYKAELDFGVFAVKKIEFVRSKRRSSMIKEIELTRNIKHQYVARCLGYWIGEEYGLIISRYKENGSLHDVLHEHTQPTLAWNVRYKIAIGVAKGLAYLHHDCDPPILHRDIKPKNILLDSNMQPCITDFGISIALNQPSSTVHLRTTYHLGTPGFMAPEIAYAIVPRCELDIYSYGVVLLELITGKKVLDPSFMEKETTLVKWFISVWRRTRELKEIVDSSIARELSDLNIMVQVIKALLVALICTQKDPRKRLKMTDVVEFFETPTDPGIFVQHDRASFHLGNAIAATFGCFQEEIKIHANEGSFSVLHKVEATTKPNYLNIICRGTHRVISKVQLYSGQVCAEKKFTFSEKKNNSLSMDREIEILGKIRHPNLVRLLEFSLEQDHGVIWYEHMPNGNLHEVLHEKNPPPLLKWNVRCKIAMGIARGLAFLHYNCHPAIVICAIKPKNIFLDSDMEPHIAPDFSVAMLLDQSSSSTPSSSVSGTQGYTTPAANTKESDVYSYGILLLQLITRKKALDPSFMKGIEIGDWVRTMWQEARGIYKIVDSGLAEELLNSNVLVQVIKVLFVALRCTENDPHIRPPMRYVIKQLEEATLLTRK